MNNLFVRSLALATLTMSPIFTVTPQSLTSPAILSLPFSGTLVADSEEIAVNGMIRIQVDSTPARKNVFIRIRSTISQTTGVGLTSGQVFEVVGASTNTCSIPAGSPLEFVSQHRLVPTGATSPSTERSHEESLPLITEIMFRGDGGIASADVRIGTTRSAASR